MELPLTIRKRQWSVVVSLIGAVTVAVFLFWLPDIYSNSLQFGFACVFCVIAVGCLGILNDRKPELAVTDRGIATSYWGVEMIEWDEIEDAFVTASPDGDFLCLSLRRPEEYYARGGRLAQIASAACRESGFGDLTIKTATMGLDANELLRLVRAQIALSKTKPKAAPSAVKYRAGH